MLPLTELGHGRQGQINKMGVVKWVSNPHVRVKGQWFYHLNAECSCPPRGTYTGDRRGGIIPFRAAGLQTTMHEVVLLKTKMGGYVDP